MRVYIAGKITGDIDYEEKFAAAEDELSDLGFEVYNPAAHYVEDWDKDFIDRNFKELMNCDIIFLLSDWAASRGAWLEYAYAKAVGMPIMTKKDAGE